MSAPWCRRLMVVLLEQWIKFVYGNNNPYRIRLSKAEHTQFSKSWGKTRLPIRQLPLLQGHHMVKYCHWNALRGPTDYFNDMSIALYILSYDMIYYEITFHNSVSQIPMQVWRPWLSNCLVGLKYILCILMRYTTFGTSVKIWNISLKYFNQFT